MSEQTEYQSAFEQGAKSKPVHTITETTEQLVALRSGYTLQDVEVHLPTPMRRKGIATLYQPDSFIAYVKTFADEDSVIFADTQSSRLTAILDYHRAGPEGSPRWGQFRATYGPRMTPEWQTWIAQNKRAMSQVEFAEFLENNLPDIARPDGAQLLEIATNLQIKKDVNFKSSVRLANGETQFTFEERHDDSAAKDEMRLPELLILGLAPYEGLPRFEVQARLRYRIKDGGHLAIWFDIVREHKIREGAFNAIVERVHDGVGSVRLVHGTVS
jgi:uncharacterized protein YfdQ (DUF2303 family)